MFNTDMDVKAVAVFCASGMGARESYSADAAALGKALAERSISLIYGGSKIGLMGVVADSVVQHGGKVVGVIPHVLVDMEVANNGCTELHVVDTMHTRKALMSEKADAFVVLPGGIGTLEEMFEVLTWQSLKLHHKPVCLLNTDGFYDGLLAFLDTCVTEGVLKERSRKLLLVARTVEEAMQLVGAA